MIGQVSQTSKWLMPSINKPTDSNPTPIHAQQAERHVHSPQRHRLMHAAPSASKPAATMRLPAPATIQMKALPVRPPPGKTRIVFPVAMPVMPNTTRKKSEKQNPVSSQIGGPGSAGDLVRLLLCGGSVPCSQGWPRFRSHAVFLTIL
ncbi:unnamed protein product [Gemmata massiliana]|uniref:Uncharacterized protein n=1 Tax=Gemmata massiliana TaxID=1210884 RepID=A0A6P2CXQ0_9BACT|nr:unnamed protein product [Gemmata massiliana]